MCYGNRQKMTRSILLSKVRLVNCVRHICVDTALYQRLSHVLEVVSHAVDVDAHYLCEEYGV
jgi:hypothetical protein